MPTILTCRHCGKALPIQSAEAMHLAADHMKLHEQPYPKATVPIRNYARPAWPGPCPCECNSGGFCGGCGHAGCGGRR